MSESHSIDYLRRIWRESQNKRLGDEMLAFAELASHPLACWQDLLDALERPGMVGEDAWLQLRSRFKDSGAAPNSREPSYWQEVLRAHGVDPRTTCRVRTSGAA